MRSYNTTMYPDRTSIPPTPPPISNKAPFRLSAKSRPSHNKISWYPESHPMTSRGSPSVAPSRGRSCNPASPETPSCKTCFRLAAQRVADVIHQEVRGQEATNGLRPAGLLTDEAISILLLVFFFSSTAGLQVLPPAWLCLVIYQGVPCYPSQSGRGKKQDKIIKWTEDARLTTSATLKYTKERSPAG